MLTEISDLQQRLDSDHSATALAAEKEASALAEQGNLEAAAMLGTIYSDGNKTIRPDRIKEFKFTRIAAELGSPLNRYWLAHLQRESRDFASAIVNARIAHEAGFSDATTLLAKMMLAGEGTAATPLEALQLLSDSVEQHPDLDAALLLAEIYLEGKYIPPNPQGAYDILHRLDLRFQIMREAFPQHLASASFQKAQAIKAGAVPRDGDTYGGLIDAAAKAGDRRAIAARSDIEHRDVELARQAEWNALASFNAHGDKWKLFTNVGTLIESESKSSTTHWGSGANRGASTSHWQVAAFQTDEGSRFTVSLPANASLVQGRKYAVVHAGPAADDSGVPVQLFDPHDGSCIKLAGNPFRAYKGIVAVFPQWVALALLFFGVLMGIVTLADGNLLTLLVALACGVLGHKMMNKLQGEYSKALKASDAYLRKHYLR